LVAEMGSNGVSWFTPVYVAYVNLGGIPVVGTRGTEKPKYVGSDHTPRFFC
jgi:hypothetical protein